MAPDKDPFTGGGFESPVQTGGKGNKSSDSISEGQPSSQPGGEFDFRFKKDEKSSEKSGHANG